MSFVSLEFAFFLPVVFFAYWTISNKYRWIILLASSYIFYMFAGYQYVLILMYITIVSFFVALSIDKLKDNKYILVGTIIIILLPLLFFKYTGFIQNNINIVLDAVSSSKKLSEMKLMLPLGISFYTFSALGYVIDVSNGKCSKENSFFQYAAGIAFFPCIASGPIERQQKLIPQIIERKEFCYDQVTYGLKLIAWGLFQKTVIADNLAVYVDNVYKNLRVYHGLTLIITVFFYSIQIYCDFSGYSDMARGVALLFGIEITKNFNCPYLSKSFQEFWGRWHISLSTWFRDYVYIPLGGNRNGEIKKARNVILTMLVSGLWHGAAWKYVFWGGIHGIVQAVEGVLKINKRGQGRCLGLFSTLFVFCTCSLLWVFFRAGSFSDACYVFLNVFHNIFDVSGYRDNWIELGFVKKAFGIIILELAILLIYDYNSLKSDVIKKISSLPVMFRWMVYVSVVIAIAQLSYKGSAGAFVYAGF